MFFYTIEICGLAGSANRLVVMFRNIVSRDANHLIDLAAVL